jgi:hypothetical protein
VTNDPSRIAAARFRRQGVEYVDREDARLLARSTKRTEWELLARAPALLMVVDGVRYRRSLVESPISFPLSAWAMSAAEVSACAMDERTQLGDRRRFVFCFARREERREELNVVCDLCSCAMSLCVSMWSVFNKGGCSHEEVCSMPDHTCVTDERGLG